MDKGEILIDRQIDRNHFIDALKGICIIFIIVTHFSWTREERLKFLFPFWIDMAVPIFMIISGFVYSFSYRKNRIQQIGDAYFFKNIIGKIVRYTVPFLMAYMIEIVFNFILGRYEGMAIPEVAMILGKKFLMGGVGPGSYYYPIMIQFVFVYPVIFSIIRRYDYKGVAICGFINAIYEVLQRAYGMNQECYRLLVLRYILLIASGCYLASETRIIKKKWATISCLVGALFILCVCYLGYSPKIIIYWTRTSFVACLYIIPIIMLLINKSAAGEMVIKMKPLEILGRSSYNIFLTQMVWYNYKAAFWGNYTSNRAFQLLMNLVTCLGVGTIFYFVETPVTKKINGIIKTYLLPKD